MPYGPHPVTVDGISLDTYAWNIEEKVRAIGALRTGDTAVPGVDGVAASVADDLEATTYTLGMWVHGADPQGLVPADPAAIAQCRENVDQLSLIFGRRHKLMDVREVIDSNGTVRQAWAKRVDSWAPTIRAGGFAKFSVSLNIPAGMWQDPDPRDWSQASVVSGNFYEIVPLRGTTTLIADGVFTVTGPAINPQINDFTVGAYCRLNANLAAGQVWRLNSDTWATRTGAGLTFGSLDTAGADAQATTRSGGSGTSRFMPLTPVVSSGQRRVFVGLSGSGFTAATSIGVRARRKFFQ